MLGHSGAAVCGCDELVQELNTAGRNIPLAAMLVIQTRKSCYNNYGTGAAAGRGAAATKLATVGILTIEV